MPGLSRLLVPVEFSPRCRGAVKYAEALSSHFHCEIVLLHVVVPPLANFSSFESMAYASATELSREVAEQRLAELELLPCTTPADAPVRRVVLEGDPTQSIVEFAASEKCDLIVMSTHGYGPFRRFLLGSVTAKVLHDAICPVWTGPHMELAPVYGAVQIRSIACCIDLGLQSRQVIGWAAGLAREFRAQLTIVHAIQASATRLSGLQFDPHWRAKLTAAAVGRIGLLQQELEIDAPVAVEAGELPAVVTTAAETLKADLLVIGRGSTPRAHGHLPTHAYAIVRESPCPVVTV